MTAQIKLLQTENAALHAEIADLHAQLEAVGAGGVGMPEIEAEQFIQTAIDSAPDQFRQLGEFLARTLDEDQWKIAERLILGGLVEIQDGRDVLGDIDNYNENMG